MLHSVARIGNEFLTGSAQPIGVRNRFAGLQSRSLK
jgi:hypothetical protein